MKEEVESSDEMHTPNDVCFPENGFYVNPFSFRSQNAQDDYDSSVYPLERMLNKSEKIVQNLYEDSEVFVQAINTQGKQRPTYIYYEGFRFTKDSSRFCKGIQKEIIYWRCSQYKQTG